MTSDSQLWTTGNVRWYERRNEMDPDLVARLQRPSADYDYAVPGLTYAEHYASLRSTEKKWGWVARASVAAIVPGVIGLADSYKHDFSGPRKYVAAVSALAFVGGLVIGKIANARAARVAGAADAYKEKNDIPY